MNPQKPPPLGPDLRYGQYPGLRDIDIDDLLMMGEFNKKQAAAAASAVSAKDSSHVMLQNQVQKLKYLDSKRLFTHSIHDLEDKSKQLSPKDVYQLQIELFQLQNAIVKFYQNQKEIDLSTSHIDNISANRRLFNPDLHIEYENTRSSYNQDVESAIIDLIAELDDNALQRLYRVKLASVIDKQVFISNKQNALRDLQLDLDYELKIQNIKNTIMHHILELNNVGLQTLYQNKINQLIDLDFDSEPKAKLRLWQTLQSDFNSDIRIEAPNADQAGGFYELYQLYKRKYLHLKKKRFSR